MRPPMRLVMVAKLLICARPGSGLRVTRNHPPCEPGCSLRRSVRYGTLAPPRVGQTRWRTCGERANATKSRSPRVVRMLFRCCCAVMLADGEGHEERAQRTAPPYKVAQPFAGVGSISGGQHGPDCPPARCNPPCGAAVRYVPTRKRTRSQGQLPPAPAPVTLGCYTGGSFADPSRPVEMNVFSSVSQAGAMVSGYEAVCATHSAIFKALGPGPDVRLASTLSHVPSPTQQQPRPTQS